MLDIKKTYEIADALVAGIESLNIDIKKRGTAESAVSPHDSLNRLYQSPDIILSHDLEERINFANSAALWFFGRNIIGQPSINLVPDIKDLREKRAEAFRKVIETGIHEPFEKSPRFKDGGELAFVTGYAFRYRIDGAYSIGALITDFSTSK